MFAFLFAFCVTWFVISFSFVQTWWLDSVVIKLVWLARGHFLWLSKWLVEDVEGGMKNNVRVSSASCHDTNDSFAQEGWRHEYIKVRTCFQPWLYSATSSTRVFWNWHTTSSLAAVHCCCPLMKTQLHVVQIVIWRDDFEFAGVSRRVVGTCHGCGQRVLLDLLALWLGNCNISHPGTTRHLSSLIGIHVHVRSNTSAQTHTSTPGQ